jgi:hypothetical protein
MTIYDILSDSLSEMDYTLLDKVLKLSKDDSNWSDEDWENYNSVAKHIVEPEVFSDNEVRKLLDKEISVYHDLGEDRDFTKQWSYIRDAHGSDNDHKLYKLCELISNIGY